MIFFLKKIIWNYQNKYIFLLHQPYTICYYFINTIKTSFQSSKAAISVYFTK